MYFVVTCFDCNTYSRPRVRSRLYDWDTIAPRSVSLQMNKKNTTLLKKYKKLKEDNCQCYKGGILEGIQPIFHGDHVDLVPVLFYPKFKLRRNLDKISLVDKDSYLRSDHYRSQYT